MAKRKYRFNIVDAVIIVLVVGLVAAAVLMIVRRAQGPDSQVQSTKVQYVIQVCDLRDRYVTNVSEGDKLFVPGSGKSLGTVLSVYSSDAFYTGVRREDGAQVISDYDGKSNLFITLEADAVLSGGRYTVEGVDILVGETLSFICPKLSADASVVSVEAVG